MRQPGAVRQRSEVIYSGRVQGVGFRYTTRAIAARFDVTGYVMNLPDGRVQLVVEGTKAELNAFLEEIARKMSEYIDTTTQNILQSSGGFDDFQIRV
ncbi:MAG: acylphosphatase [Planctomycetes bacterium]|nr:acylphosphatase [Planctomycetota bacterium]